MSSLIIENSIKLLLEKTKPDSEKYKVNMSGVWTSWPESCKHIPYKALRSSADGPGPGEEKLAFLMGTKPAGSGVSYDIDSPMYGKWEVKDVTKGSFKAGTESTAVSAPMRSEISGLTSIVVATFGKGAAAKRYRKLLTKDQIAVLDAFLNSNANMILKDEISNTAIQNLLKIIEFVNTITKKESNGSEATKYVELGDVGGDNKEVKITKQIDLQQFIKLGTIAGASKEELSVSDSELLATAFSEYNIKNPKQWYKRVWENSVKASNVFSIVDGLILVKESGYRVIKRDELDSCIKFSGITQARAYFKVVK